MAHSGVRTLGHKGPSPKLPIPEATCWGMSESGCVRLWGWSGQEGGGGQLPCRKGAQAETGLNGTNPFGLASFCVGQAEEGPDCQNLLE